MPSADRYSRPARTDGKVTTAWRARWVDDEGRARSKAGFDRKADALAFAADREAEQRHGLTLAPQPTGATTLAQWSATWLAGLEVREGTAESYHYALRRILPTLGDRPLSALRPSELRSWRRALGERYAEATAAQTASILAMVLRAAVHDGLLEKTPMPPGRGGKGGRVVDPAELLTPEQVRAWDEALPPYARGMALVAALTGLRQGELLGLRLDRVEFLHRRLHVDAQLVTRAGGPVFGPPKTAAGYRGVPLPAPAAEALAAHVAAFPSPPGEPLFLGARGQRWRRGTFGDCWRAARDRAGLPSWAHWHALRDTALSGYIRAGVDVRTVMSLAGHASPDETLRTYARMWEDSSDNARAAVEALWSVPENSATKTVDSR